MSAKLSYFKICIMKEQKTVYDCLITLNEIKQKVTNIFMEISLYLLDLLSMLTSVQIFAK